MGEWIMTAPPHLKLPEGWTSPSDGISSVEEGCERFIGCLWIDRILARFDTFFIGARNDSTKTRMKLQCTAHFYMQSIYNYRSVKLEDKGVVSLAAIHLANKVMEHPRKLRDLMTCYELECSKMHPGLSLDENEVHDLREAVTRNESFILRVVGFNLSPPTTCFEELESLISTIYKESLNILDKHQINESGAWKKNISLLARSFLCDSYRGMAVHTQSSYNLALACLMLACNFYHKTFCSIALLLEQWHTIFPDSNLDELEEAKTEICYIYSVKRKVRDEVLAGRICDLITLPDQTPFLDGTATCLTSPESSSCPTGSSTETSPPTTTATGGSSSSSSASNCPSQTKNKSYVGKIYKPPVLHPTGLIALRKRPVASPFSQAKRRCKVR